MGPLIYGLIHFRKSLKPLVLILAGLLIGAVPFAFSHGLELLMGLGERERIIAGERHLVLTGWDRPDYSILTSRTDVVVLEIGNPNVDDQTLKLLLPLTKLRELTLNDSVISDEGLKLLRQLPALESLRVARTKITKEGVVEFLGDPPGEAEGPGCVRKFDPSIRASASGRIRNRRFDGTLTRLRDSSVSGTALAAGVCETVTGG